MSFRKYLLGISLIGTVGFSFEANAQTYRLWDVIPEEEVPFEQLDTVGLWEYLSSDEGKVYDRYPIRHLFYVRFADSLLEGRNLQLSLEWPLEPGVSEERIYRDVEIDNWIGTLDSLPYKSISGRVLDSFPLGIISGGFSTVGLSQISFQPVPIVYVAYALQKGLNPEYGVFVQQFFPGIHPATSSTTATKFPALTLYPNPTQSYVILELSLIHISEPTRPY